MTASNSTKEEESEQSQVTDTFSWTDQWYAVAGESDVLEDKLYSLMLFDRPLVLYRNGERQYNIWMIVVLIDWHHCR